MNNRHALVIGGTRGLGRALVQRFLDQGRQVSVLARRPPVHDSPAAPKARYWQADLVNTAALLAGLDEIIKGQGKIQSLVFLQRYRGESDSWEGELATSLTATQQVIEYLREQFIPGQDNAIVIINSNAAEIVVPEQPLAYHVAKGALLQVVRYYALHLGPQGIRVNGVCPITTLKTESKDYYLKNAALMDLYRKIIPLGRLGTADEIANVVSFLCSADASFITGQNLTVDGGISLRGHEALAHLLTKN